MHILEKEETQGLVPCYLPDDFPVWRVPPSVTHKTGISGHFCLSESGPERTIRLATESPRAAVDTLATESQQSYYAGFRVSTLCHTAHGQSFQVNLGATDFQVPLGEPGQAGGSWMS